MKNHKVKLGDCFSSVAKKHGFDDADTLYSHTANASLKSKRNNMHVLNPKDLIKIPDKAKKEMELTAESCSSITVKGIITELKIVLEDFAGVPLADTQYELDVEGIKFTGKTDGSGLLSHKIDAESVDAQIIVYLDADKKNCLTWPLKIGCLVPHTETEGVQSRLNNLGYYCDNETGNIDDTTKLAVNAFKKNTGLADDDAIDQALKDKLLAVYGL